MAYSFGGTTGETAESLKRKRAYVMALLENAGAGRTPSTVGEGIGMIGEALAGRAGKAVLDKKEREGTASVLGEVNRNPEIRRLLLGDMGGAAISGTGGANTLSGSAGRDRLGSAKPFKVDDPAAEDLAPHQRAFLNAVSGGESGGAYNVRYTPRGPAYFNDLSAHPGIFEPGPHGKTSASGRYQFTKTTWDGMGGGDFSPANQDRMAWKLAQRDYGARTGRNLDSDLQAGGLTPQIMETLTPTWQAFKGNRGRHAATYRDSLGRYSGRDNLDGSEGDDTFNEPVQMAGVTIGLKTPDAGPAPMQRPMPDDSRFGPAAAPKADRLPQPGAFNPMQAAGPFGPQPQMPAPNGPTPAGREYFAGNAAPGGMMQPPMPQQTPQPQPPMPQPDPMQVAAVPRPQPRMPMSQRGDSAGYSYGPGGQYTQAGGAPQQTPQGGGLLARLLMRQPMPQGGGQAPQAAPQGNPQAAPQQGDDMMRVYQLLQDPYLPEGYRTALLDALKRKQEQADPAYQADLAYRQAQIRALENPEVEPGYRVLSEAEEKEMGLDPAGSYQIGGKDNKVDRIGGNGVTINTGDVKVPTGYRPLDPNNPGAGVEPIPGGPATEISAEVAARMGMAKGFIDNFPAIEREVAEGGLTGIWDRGQATIGRGRQGELDRQIKSGVDALQRMLTGAGMPVSEAAAYANRYLPGLMDDATTATSKLRGLKYDLENAGEVVGRGRGGSPIGTPAGGAEDPLGIR